jgi:hypothetical protein
MKILVRSVLSLVLALGGAGIALAAASGGSDVHRLEGGYSIQVPISVTLTQGKPMPDFLLYRVTDNTGHLLLIIYLGSAPDTRFKPPANAVTSTMQLGGYPSTSVRWRGNNGSFSGTTLIQLTGDAGFRVAHMAFQSLSKTDSEIAERIVRSFRKDGQP